MSARGTTLAAGLATIGAAGVSATAVWVCAVTPQPFAWAAGAVAAVTGLWTIAGAVAIARTLSSVAPPEPTPEEPPRPAWEVFHAADNANAFDMDDLLPGLRPPERTLLIEAVPGLSAADPLTHEDLGFLLWTIYKQGRPSRRQMLGIRLPSHRKLSRPRYDETVDLLCQAGIVLDRCPKFSGRWNPSLTLSAALTAIDVNPEALPLDRWQSEDLGSRGLGWAGLGTVRRNSAKLIVAKITGEEN